MNNCKSYKNKIIATFIAFGIASSISLIFKRHAENKNGIYEEMYHKDNAPMLVQLNQDNSFLQNLESQFEFDVQKVAKSIVGVTYGVQYPTTMYQLGAAGAVLSLIPQLATLGAVLTTVAPLTGPNFISTVLKDLKNIESVLDQHQRQTLSKLDKLEDLLRDNNCQGSIKKSIDTINSGWDALIGIAAAE